MLIIINIPIMEAGTDEDLSCCNIHFTIRDTPARKKQTDEELDLIVSSQLETIKKEEEKQALLQWQKDVGSDNETNTDEEQHTPCMNCGVCDLFSYMDNGDVICECCLTLQVHDPEPEEEETSSEKEMEETTETKIPTLIDNIDIQDYMYHFDLLTANTILIRAIAEYYGLPVVKSVKNNRTYYKSKPELLKLIQQFEANPDNNSHIPRCRALIFILHEIKAAKGFDKLIK